jgi:hypothetical protein
MFDAICEVRLPLETPLLAFGTLASRGSLLCAVEFAEPQIDRGDPAVGFGMLVPPGNQIGVLSTKLAFLVP